MNDEHSSFIVRVGKRGALLGAPRKSLRLVRPNLDLDTAVELAPFRGVVRGARLRFAISDGLEARAANAKILEIVGYRPRTAFGQPLVVCGGTDRVGVTLHRDCRA